MKNDDDVPWVSDFYRALRADSARSSPCQIIGDEAGRNLVRFELRDFTLGPLVEWIFLCKRGRREKRSVFESIDSLSFPSRAAGKRTVFESSEPGESRDLSQRSSNVRT